MVTVKPLLGQLRGYSKTVTKLFRYYSKTNTWTLSFWGVLKKKAEGPKAPGGAEGPPGRAEGPDGP